MHLGSKETMRFIDGLGNKNQSAVLLLAESGQTEKTFDILERLEADYLDRNSLKERELLFKANRLLKSNGLVGGVNGRKT